MTKELELQIIKSITDGETKCDVFITGRSGYTIKRYECIITGPDIRGIMHADDDVFHIDDISGIELYKATRPKLHITHK